MSARKLLVWALIFVLISGCSLIDSHKPGVYPTLDQPVPRQQIIELICGSYSNCIQAKCPDLDQCPIILALSHPDVFDFVATYSKCEDCNTPELSRLEGIGKCIEYEISEAASDYEVQFKLSEKCDFKYGSPGEVRIFILIDSNEWHIKQIDPPPDYIRDPSYCLTESDCRCLSGSGVELIGTSNAFYAPINWSGYYESERCDCVAEKCIIVDDK